jgi:hypothetical protein
VPFDEVLLLGKKDLWFNHKIMIKVQELLPNIMVTRNLLSMKVWVMDWLCKGRRITPSAPYLM